MGEPTRVLIVDDSRIFRAALEQALSGQDDVAVVGSVFSGDKALQALRDGPAPDLVTLDVEMPGRDGLETLLEIQRLNAARPPGSEVGVIMVSAHTRQGADVTIKALRAGAFDFVPKPGGGGEAENLATLRRELLPRIRAWAARRRGAPPRPRTPSSLLRPRPSGLKRPVRAVLVAVSTGGPRALEVVLPDLCRRRPPPVVVVQHMPPLFIGSLADSLGRLTPGPVVVAGDDEPLQPGTVYIAQGGRHLVLRGDGLNLRSGLTDQPPENGFRPSADVLFRSAAAVLGGGAVAVVLTGMGRDGTSGLGPLKRAGAHVIAQDEASSVVWGMPGSAVQAGLTDEVLPLDRIAAAVQAAVAARGG